MRKMIILLTIFLSQLPAFAQSIKPNITFLNENDYSDIFGCNYSLDDWKGNIFLVATYPFSNSSENHLYIKIDGKIWKLTYTVVRKSMDETTLQVLPSDQPFLITMSTQKWKKIGTE